MARVIVDVARVDLQKRMLDFRLVGKPPESETDERPKSAKPKPHRKEDSPEKKKKKRM